MQFPSTRFPKYRGLAEEGLGIDWVCRYLCSSAAKRRLFHCIHRIRFRSGSESLMERWFCVINPRWNAEGYWSFSVRRAYQCCRCIKKKKKSIQSFLLKWGLLWYREGQVLIVFVESLLDPLQHYLYLLQRGVIFEQLWRQEC